MEVKLDPITGMTLFVKLFGKVENVPQLRQKLIKGELKCCIVKPVLIIDPFQLVVAANKAAVAETLTTRTIYTEILFNLSISKNITQSLQKFGVDDKDTNILVLVLCKDGEAPDHIFREVSGEELDIDALKDISEIDTIKKTYKISDNELKTNNIIDSVISRIVTKDFVSY